MRKVNYMDINISMYSSHVIFTCCDIPFLSPSSTTIVVVIIIQKLRPLCNGEYITAQAHTHTPTHTSSHTLLERNVFALTN